MPALGRHLGGATTLAVRLGMPKTDVGGVKKGFGLTERASGTAFKECRSPQCLLLSFSSAIFWPT